MMSAIGMAVQYSVLNIFHPPQNLIPPLDEVLPRLVDRLVLRLALILNLEQRQQVSGQRLYKD